MTQPVSPLHSGLIHRLDTLSKTDSDMLTGLDERLVEAMAQMTVENQQTRETIFQAMNDPAVTSDPALLAHWQQRLSVYTLDTSLYSTLARKGVAAIETLVKT